MASEEQAMTSERLAELRAQVEAAGFAAAEMPDPEYAYNLYTYGSELLAEVERQRAREAALVAVVERVAASADGRMLMCMCGVPIPTTRYDNPTVMLIGEPVTHTPDCVFAQARALVASAGDGEQGEA